ncbi:glycosyltransferase [Nibricoccus aquaticus]|uniref:Glycosyltransferase n=1 Tax=Nibricoccus aquaticus TaxID=2576891 RepID=A0A290QHW7_9BACT|nr:glycosyltransferase [Nibricoccus aquaticus]ATC64928.1 glycosyltransferase [Nibricoccus aquaticus]
MSKLRILVLTSSTGGGHDARAQAFAEWCFQLYRHEIDVRIEQMLEKSSFVNRSGVNFYNWIQRKMPILHTAFYTVVEVLSFLNKRTVTLGRGYYLEVIQEYRPHLVFSVHDCLNRGYFQLARKILGEGNVRCATYCGEFSGGWGYSFNWIEPTVDLYFSRTPTAMDYAVKQGIPRERARVRGHLMLPRAHQEVMTREEREEYRVKKLGLRRSRFTVFLATGSNGANNHFDLLPTLLRHADKCQVIIICGRDQQTFNELIHWRANHPELPCYIEAYSEIVHLLMQASDAIVSRGGTTSCAKALNFRCPIIFNAFGGIMPQESLTWKFFRNGAASEKIASAGDFARLFDRWMGEPQSYAEYRRKFLELRYDEDPTVLIDELVGLAWQAGGGTLNRQPYPPRSGGGNGSGAAGESHDPHGVS